MRLGLKTAALSALMALALSGCGVRGSLEAPTEAKAQGQAASAEAAASGPNSAAAPKPHRGFILDGLVR